MESSAAAGNYTNSTIFVDVVGSLSGVDNTTDLTATSTTSAIKDQADAVSETVKAGYIVRASADWNVSLSPPCYLSSPMTQQLNTKYSMCLPLICLHAHLLLVLYGQA